MRCKDIFEAADHDLDLKARYQHFNKLLFGGKLPDIPVKWAVLKNVGGSARLKMIRDPSKPPPNRFRIRLGSEDKYSDRMIIPGSLHILMSSLYKRSQEAIDKILLHEMIHIHFMVTGHLGELHGPRFEAERRRLSEIVGFEIPLTDTLEHDEFAVDVAIKPYGVILLELKDGGGYRYVMMPASAVLASLEAIRERLAYFVRFNYYTQAYVFTIQDKKWSEQSKRTIVQRVPFGYKTKYYPLRDQDAVDDLLQNGTLLARLTKDSPEVSAVAPG